MNSGPADAIIVGGGPSGVAAALALKRAGAGKVVLLEREQYLGGATRHCSHSPFGMLEFGRLYFGASYGKRLERECEDHGLDVRYGHSVVRLHDDATLLAANHRGLETLAARRILVTTGARELPRSARMVTGDRPLGVLTTGTLQSSLAFHGMMPFKRPVIVGSELVTLSAVATCLTHGARPVAVIERRQHALARAPLTWFPGLAGVPFHRNATIMDIVGNARVEAVKVRLGDMVKTLECDGVLFTGEFLPEASLFQASGLEMDAGSAGPAVDQDGRCANPLYFAAGNVLRAVETGGWSFREGASVGRALAWDLMRGASTTAPVRVRYDSPLKLVVPNLIRPGESLHGGLRAFQLRFFRIARGSLRLLLDGKEAWQARGCWKPERRILVPAAEATRGAESIEFRFIEER